MSALRWRVSAFQRQLSAVAIVAIRPLTVSPRMVGRVSSVRIRHRTRRGRVLWSADRQGRIARYWG